MSRVRSTMGSFLPIVIAALLASSATAYSEDSLPFRQPTEYNLPLKAYENDGWRPASEYSNWVDHLPFKILFDQSLFYNDNLLLLPNGAVIPPNMKRGDFYSTTTIGASSRIPFGAQAFFVNGTLGISRYAHDTSLNSTNYSAEAGWDWVFTSRCAGRFVGSDRKIQAPIEELTSFTVNNIETAAFKETAKCRVGNQFNVNVDSGLSHTTNSLTSAVVNNYDQHFIRGGLEYEVREFYSFGAQATFTKSDYINRSPISTPGLATGLDQKAYEFFFRGLLSPKLEIDATFGIIESTASSPVLSSTFSNTTYSIKAKWQATPKLAFEALIAQTVAPPQNIVADFERIQQERLTAIYLFSPKLTFNWSIGLSTIKNPTVSGIGLSPILVNQTVFFSDLRAIYHITPLLNATGEYRYTDRKDDTTGLRATSNLFMLGLTYQR
jgi:hypothetical protein